MARACACAARARDVGTVAALASGVFGVRTWVRASAKPFEAGKGQEKNESVGIFGTTRKEARTSGAMAAAVGLCADCCGVFWAGARVRVCGGTHCAGYAVKWRPTVRQMCVIVDLAVDGPSFLCKGDLRTAKSLQDRKLIFKLRNGKWAISVFGEHFWQGFALRGYVRGTK